MINNVIRGAVLAIASVIALGYSQQFVLKGRVVDESNQPVQGAVINVLKADTSSTTDWNGNFSLDMTSTHTLRTADPVANIISFQNGVLSFNLYGNKQQIQIEVYNNKGVRVNKEVVTGYGSGVQSISILPENVPVAMYFVKFQIGNRASVFNVINIKNRIYSLPGRGLFYEKADGKQSAAVMKVIDTVEISKDGFQKTQIAIESYATDLSTITLKKIESNLELPPITNGKSAKTTRYWDCCKPHCGWNSNMRQCGIDGKDLNDQGAQSGCSGGPSFQCWDYSPIEMNSKVSYGWAAFNNSGTQCGDCFQLAFSGALQGKQMIVQVVNIGDGGTDAFDLLIPGGGVGALNGCSRQWNNAPLGVQYGGFHSSCGDNADCIRNMCKAAFGDKEDLMRGCDWYLNWFKMTSNPQVMYMKVSCPKEIKDISRIGN